MIAYVSALSLRKTKLLSFFFSLCFPIRSYSSLQFNQLFDRCLSVRDLKRIHALILTSGSRQNLLVSTKLITKAYTLSAKMDYAHKVFAQMPERDVVVWNTVIRGYSDVGPCHKALILYHKMRQDGNPWLFPFVLRSCAILSALGVGKQVHCNVIKNGFDSAGFVQSSLVTMYSQGGDILNMEWIFGDMSERNVVSWSVMIAGYVQNGPFEEGLTVFRDMLVIGSHPNAVTLVSVLPACASLKLLSVGRLIHGYGVKMGMDSQLSMVNALIALYGKCGNVDAAQLLFDQMSVRDLVSWNSMTAAYEQNNASSDAIRLFLRMQNEKMDYNYITMVSVISACTSAGDLTGGRWVHEMVKNKGLETNASIQNALINMYSKCGDIASARCIFERLPHRNVVARRMRFSWSSGFSHSAVYTDEK